MEPLIITDEKGPEKIIEAYADAGGRAIVLYTENPYGYDSQSEQDQTCTLVLNLEQCQKLRDWLSAFLE